MKDLYADIIVDISQEKLDKTFQYLVPKEMEPEIEEGKKVRIPFGKGGREITGYVVGLSSEPKIEAERIKPILAVEEQGMEIESRLISLAAWIARNYGSTMNQALKTVLPVKEKAAARERRYICLKADPKICDSLLNEYVRKHYRAKERLMRALLQKKILEYSSAIKEMKISPEVVRGFEKEELISVEKERCYRTPLPRMLSPEKPALLNEEQQQAVREILEEWDLEFSRPCLIKGVTGSGKTEVYMELIRHMLEQGRQVILLIPEIALTYQNVSRFYARFGEKVSLIHSRMSQGERYDQFERAKEGKISVMIGPRSALFTPFPRLGLILIDEEHEDSYKSEKTPCYHARETAIQRGKMEGAYVVMGSASPSVESYYKAQTGTYRLVRLEQRYGGSSLPAVSIVDLREELKTGNRSVFSELLTGKIQERLKKKEQVILFLNRRGYSGFVTCRSCGHVMKCPHCDVSLTSHRNGRLICHYCGYETMDVQKCPVCGSPYIGGFRAGTQQIESLVLKSFPGAKVLRMDADTTRKKDDHEKILSAFGRGEADMLIGTQMIVKGHDFPRVTLVGVLAADLSLCSGDYRAGEKTFQLLLQAVGRAGRGERPGEAVIQTYHPDHYSIQAAAAQDYDWFYQEEMDYRSLMDYPPMAAMAAVRGAGKEEELLVRAMDYCRKYIERIYPGKDLTLIGPAPESVAKVQDMYRRVLYMRHQDREILVRIKNALEKYIEVNRGFRNIYIQYDFTV
ncbi:MAG TPA: primosomal protein N' [Candidatus Blautia pullistercoris]|uniref:Replication restart protein PriA n=1 Tax=Candidatus Blautia pullistercoris TaxID=2838499 RepID=A0A9D2AN33_9FIRM|nr:primosomal protein N' [Candidatus Blautia pullistercoris]